MKYFQYAIEINGIRELLIFEDGIQHNLFRTYISHCRSAFLDVTTIHGFLFNMTRIKKLEIPDVSDDRFVKWRDFFLQKKEKEIKEEEERLKKNKERKRGYIPKCPTILESADHLTMKDILNELKNESTTGGIVSELYNMVNKKNYFDRESINVKGFFTFFSIELLGEEKKRTLYDYYISFLNKGKNPRLLDK